MIDTHATSRMVLRIHHRIARSRVGRLCDVRAVRRVVSPLFEMESADVVSVLDALEAEGVMCWLAGGWGADALFGRQTRRHVDLDVVVLDEPVQVERAGRALATVGLRWIGQRPPSVLMPRRMMFADTSGRSVDVLPIDRHRPPFDGGAPHDSPFARGRIAGRSVGCLSARVQLQVHQGFPLSAAADADVTALRRHLERDGTSERES